MLMVNQLVGFGAQESAVRNGWDPLKKSASVTLSSANMVASSASYWHNALSVTGVASGKRYGEVTITTLTGGAQAVVALATSAASLTAQLGATDNYAWAYREPGWFSYNSGAGFDSGYSVFVQGDKIGVAYDAGTGKMWFAVNNVWQTGNPSSGTSPIRTITAGTTLYLAGGPGVGALTINDGSSAFAYSAPSGFSAWAT